MAPSFQTCGISQADTSEQDHLRASAQLTARFLNRPESALCAKCLVVSLTGCSLPVTANVRARSWRQLIPTDDVLMRPSL
jgi:hypothetical protein